MILVIGASGNVGAEVARLLKEKGVTFNSPSRIEFDFEHPETFSQTFEGIDRVFLIRPPAISDAQVILPALEAAKNAGVKQIVFLSLLGAEKNRFLPHRKIEDLILELGVPYTFLRPSFFMQNAEFEHHPRG